jgi:prevent-host-death family protein
MYNMYMTTFIPVTEARDKLSEIVGRVHYGEEIITLTYHGNPAVVILHPDSYQKLLRDVNSWEKIAHPKQLPPDHLRHPTADKNGYRCKWTGRDGVEHICQGQEDWSVWLFFGGRRTGKTLTGANWIVSQAVKYPKLKWAVVEPTDRELIEMGFSKILKQTVPGEIVDYNKNDRRIVMSNGSEIYGFTADESPRKQRSIENLAGVWLDEVRSYPNSRIWEELLRNALGDGAKVVVTTTPSSHPLLVSWWESWQQDKACGVHTTYASTLENDGLPPDYQVTVADQMDSKWGKAEYSGEMPEDDAI